MNKRIEATSEPNSPESLTITPVVACMGASACSRVCQHVSPGAEPVPTNSDGAFPLEHDCAVLENVDAQPLAVAQELLSVSQLPNLIGLQGDQVIEEASNYLDHLLHESQAFNTYLQSILRGKHQPRFALVQAEASYQESDVYNGAYKPETDEEKEELLLFHGLLRGFHDMHTMRETGLLFDNAMRQLFIKSAREIGVGHHVKLVGEPGIAKTTFAKYLALQNTKAHYPEKADVELEPLVISFSSTSEAEAQVSEQTFEEGKLGSKFGKIAEAMKHGRGVVLDEQNGLTADQQTFFNDLFLKKPGQSVTIDGVTFTVAKGFCIIATLNPMTDTQGNRRHGRQQQDSANAARFTRIDFKYPYQQGYIGSSDEAISRIFFAHYVDSFGWKMPSTEMINLLDSTRELMNKLTKKATEPTQDGTTTSITNATSRPDLAECISPRDLSRILEVSFGYGDSETAVLMTRQQIYEKAQQILTSDNGHFVTPLAKSAVDQLLREAKFHA